MEPQTIRNSIWPAHGALAGASSWAKRVALLLGTLLTAVLAVVGVAVTYASPSPYASLPQSVAPEVASAHLVGATATTQQLSLGISLHSRNAAGMQAYAQQVAQPKSKLFHQYLTPAQFASAFGADPVALNSVERYLQAQGLHLDNVQSGGLLVTFSGSVAQVQSAFHTHINNYKAADGRSFYANATALQLPSSLAPMVLDVAGTETARVEHPSTMPSKQHKAVTGHTSVTCPTTTFTAATTGYTFSSLLPTGIAKAYAMNNTTNPGNNVWMAMIEDDGFSTADLYQYALCSGTISSDIASAIRHSSGTSYSSDDLIITRYPGSSQALTPGSDADAVEAELETVLGLVPNLKHLAVVETHPTVLGMQLALADIANNNGAQVVADTWGMCEADLGFPNAQAEEQLFMQMALQGQSVFAAAGDTGLYACYGDNANFQEKGFAVNDPASDPFVTAVGGTELTVAGNTNATATFAAEQPWVDTTNKEGGNGGLSLFWTAQPWQTNAKSSVATLNGGAYSGVLAVANSGSNPSRVVPDVAAMADPTNSSVAMYCTVGSNCTSGATTFDTMGGTGVATAIWAAAGAEAVQAAAPSGSNTGGRLSLIAPALYTTYQNDLTSLNGLTSAGTNFCDYAKQLGISTTTSAVIQPGSQAVTPASMTGIVAGSVLNIDSAGNQENVTVTATTSTTFTGVFTHTHNAAFTVVGVTTPVSVTETTHAAGAVETLTLSAGTVGGDGIVVGAKVHINDTTASFSDTEYVLSTPGGSGGTTFTILAGAAYTAGNTATVDTSTVINTTVASALNSWSQTVTLASTAGLTASQVVTVDTGGSAETDTLTAVSGSTITATFTKTHSSGVAVVGRAEVGATSFNSTCGAGATKFALYDSTPIANGGTVTSSFLATDGFQQLPTTTTNLYGSAAGFAVKNLSGPINASGYNALTGLGSPHVGDTTGGTAALAQYLAAQSRQGFARMYMVAQASSDKTYWIGSYTINPYVQNMPTYTQWFKLGSTIFAGAPSIADNGIVGGTATHLYIFGPSLYSTTGIAEIDWNLLTNTGTTISTSVAALPASGSCSSVSAFTNADTIGAPGATGYAIYCVTSDGKLFVNKINASTGAFVGATWTALTAANALSAAPQVASDGYYDGSDGSDPDYAVIYQTPGSNNLKFLYVPGAGAGAFTTLTSTIVLGSASVLSTTCNSTPSLAFVPRLGSYAASCIASDTHNMWANVYNPARSSGHQWNSWELLGQPSPSVTFQPGSVVAVDRIVTDPGYNLVFYIAEGSDNGMYLDVANPNTSSTIGDTSGWTNVSLPGIFNGNAGADFANA